MKRNLIAALAAVLLLAACTGADDDAGPDETASPAADGTTTPATIELGEGDLQLVSSLRTFDACDALLDHLRTEGAERVGPYGLDGDGWYHGVDDVARGDIATADTEAADDAGADAAVEAPAEQAAATTGVTADGDLVEGEDYSGTNTVETGVDEPDLVKTDGERIVVLSAGELVVVDAATRQIAGRTAVADGWSPELLLAGDEVLLVTSADPGTLAPATRAVDDSMPAFWEPVTVVQRISLDGTPTVIETMRVDGSYVSARAVDGTARIVLRSAPGGNLPFVHPANPAGEELATETNRAVVADSELEDWLPGYSTHDAGGELTGEGFLTPCDRVHAPTTFAGFGVLSVLSVAVDGPLDPSTTTSVLAPGDLVYASPSSLYVATTAWIDPWLAEDDPDAAQQAYDERRTSIHRFDLGGAAAEYASSGSVPGDLHNEFSMSEHDGILRVVTTTGDTWDGSSETFVRTLGETEGALVEIGSVGDLGNGEAVQSVRFAGDTGYVVTFRQVDPFYTIDLSEPADPRVVGELKIPGFSSYLHPIGDGRVLGVGSTADEQTGQVTGAKVAIYDVSDPANPLEIATWDAPDGWNDVGWEHRAFLWWAPERIAVIPLQLWSEGWSGAVVLRVDDDTITEVGRIDHMDQAQEQIGCEPLELDVDTADPDEFETELQWMVRDGARIFVCDPGENVSISGFGCYEEPWIADEAARLGVEIEEAARVITCWPEGGDQRPIVRSLAIGEDLWTLSYQWGDTSQIGLLKANALPGLEELAAIGLG